MDAQASFTVIYQVLKDRNYRKNLLEVSELRVNVLKYTRSQILLSEKRSFIIKYSMDNGIVPEFIDK